MHLPWILEEGEDVACLLWPRGLMCVSPEWEIHLHTLLASLLSGNKSFIPKHSLKHWLLLTLPVVDIFIHIFDGLDVIY